jgi:hypothetical protein
MPRGNHVDRTAGESWLDAAYKWADERGAILDTSNPIKWEESVLEYSATLPDGSTTSVVVS